MSLPTAETESPDLGHHAPPGTEPTCPTPLAWQEVREAIRRDGHRCKAVRGDVAVSAWMFGEGTPLYLVPGFFGDHELFYLTSWLLREECCSVMLDFPVGADDSKRTATETLAGWAAAVVEFADTLGHTSLRLYGTGFGGLVVLQTLLDHPLRVSSACLQCGFAHYRLSLLERLLTTWGRHSHRTLGEVPSAARFQEQNHRHWFPPFDATRWEFYARNVANTPVATSSLRAQVAHAVDLRSQLGRIEAPVLLIGSEGDGAIAVRAREELAKGLARCRSEIIDNCGRLPHVTHPHRLVKLLRAFWEAPP